MNERESSGKNARGTNVTIQWKAILKEGKFSFATELIT